MATSAFKSTTKRPSLTSCSSDYSSTHSSRSLGGFSPETEAGYNRNSPRGKFVNTTRGSWGPFPEISLDDLVLEFFPSSSNNDNESDGVVERMERPGRSASRLGEVGRRATGTASSRRRARSVSKNRGDVVSSSSASWGKNVSSNEAGSRRRRRRSLSVAKYQISDSESEVENYQNSSECATVKSPISWNSQNPVGQKTTTSSSQRLGRSRSYKNISMLHDGYSSEYPLVDFANGGLYEAMRKEIKCAVEEIRTELNQTIGRNQTAVASRDHLNSEISESLEDSSGINEKYASELAQSEKQKQKQKQDPVTEAQGELEERPNPNSRARKSGSSICNVEDSDTSTTTIRPLPLEMDGVILPWLQWESLSPNTTPKRVHTTPDIREKGDEDIQLELVFEMYRQRNRINSGALLLCTYY